MLDQMSRDHVAGGFQDDETAFPFLVYDLLEDAERLGFANIVSWVRNGSRFAVHDREKFTKHILPAYFKQSQFKSFQRQLNFYSFDRARGGPFAGMLHCLPNRRAMILCSPVIVCICPGSYSHDNLVRGSRKLCHLIVRSHTPRTNVPKSIRQSKKVGKCDRKMVSRKQQRERIPGDESESSLSDSGTYDEEFSPLRVSASTAYTLPPMHKERNDLEYKFDPRFLPLPECSGTIQYAPPSFLASNELRMCATVDSMRPSVLSPLFSSIFGEDDVDVVDEIIATFH